MVARKQLSLITLIVAASALGPVRPACASTEQVLYRFQGGVDGSQPIAGLVADAAGNLYGTASANGSAGCGGVGCGTVFELSPQKDGSWTETTLYVFQGGTDGEYPNAPLLVDATGNLYGTTLEGGSDNCGAGTGCGTVFELSRGKNGWTERVLYAFTTRAHAQSGARAPQSSFPDVWSPNGIVFDSGGNLYGFGSLGGHCVQNGHLVACYGGGFELAKPTKQSGRWKEKVIYRVHNALVTGPEGPPIFDASGNLYALATDAGYGSIFELRPPDKKYWRESTLYTFEGGGDGGYPAPGVAMDAGGNLYGATTGYLSLPGNVFELVPEKRGQWMETPLYTFSDSDDGETPAAAPVLDANGNLYGVTEAGGLNGIGVTYELSPGKSGWSEALLYSFAGTSDGATPEGTVLLSNGNLYGVTYAGGNGGCYSNQGCGTVFEVTP